MKIDPNSPQQRLANIFKRNRKKLELNCFQLSEMARVNGDSGIFWVESLGKEGQNPGWRYLKQVAEALSGSFGYDYLPTVESLITTVCPNEFPIVSPLPTEQPLTQYRGLPVGGSRERGRTFPPTVS